MLIPFANLVRKYNIKSEGVLHIGASIGQEMESYYQNGIKRSVWIEAIPEICDQLYVHSRKFTDAICINACVSDVDGKEVDFNISSNNGESSSILPLGTHKVVHPEVHYVQTIKCTTSSVLSLFINAGLNPEDYTFLNIDLQGSELLALRGMGHMLWAIDYAYLEVNKAELYIDCPMIEEIDSYMASFNFVRVETEWAGNTGWGDAFYVKKHLL